MSRRHPQQSRSKATVDGVLDATVRVIEREGLARLTTARVAAEAGCSVGAIYAYFANKQALMLALYARFGQRLLAGMGRALQAGAEDWRDLANAAFDAFLDFYRSEPGYRAVWIGTAWDPDLVDAGQGWGATFEQGLVPVLQQFKPSLSESEALRIGRVAISLCSSLVTLGLQHEDDALIEEGRHALLAYLRERLD